MSLASPSCVFASWELHCLLYTDASAHHGSLSYDRVVALGNSTSTRAHPAVVHRGVSASVQTRQGYVQSGSEVMVVILP